jgi:hypothetical protein
MAISRTKDYTISHLRQLSSRRRDPQTQALEKARSECVRSARSQAAFLAALRIETLSASASSAAPAQLRPKNRQKSTSSRPGGTSTSQVGRVRSH